MTSSQPTRPVLTGLPRGRHMMGPTVITHGLFLSQICLFMLEKQSPHLSLTSEERDVLLFSFSLFFFFIYFWESVKPSIVLLKNKLELSLLFPPFKVKNTHFILGVKWLIQIPLMAMNLARTLLWLPPVSPTVWSHTKKEKRAFLIPFTPFPQIENTWSSLQKIFHRCTNIITFIVLACMDQTDDLFFLYPEHLAIFSFIWF